MDERTNCISGVDSASKDKLTGELIITDVVCDENGIAVEVTICQNSTGRKFKIAE